MFVLTPATIALCVCVPLLAFFVVKWLFTKDTEIENRRRSRPDTRSVPTAPRS